MFRIALRSLLFDRSKLLASLAGVAFAATLVLVQMGLYAGFLSTSSASVRRVGGDLWLTPRGAQVVDNSEPMGPTARALALEHPCVKGVRGLVLSFMGLRKRSGARDAVMLFGFSPEPDRVLPWTMSRGLPQDLHAPMRVTVDEGDLAKLQIEGDPLGASLEVGDRRVWVAGLTRGVRSFTLTPYLFTELSNARRILGMRDDRASYWIVDLYDPACMNDVRAAIRRHPDLDAYPTAEFARMTEVYWVDGSGAGTALAFSALLGLVVGVVIVGQTLYAMTREHLRELATLKAVGATSAELMGFVGWQAAFLAGIGGLSGLGLSMAVQRALEPLGLTLVLSSGVLLTGGASVLGMCVLASVSSLRAVFKLDAAEVFK